MTDIPGLVEILYRSMVERSVQIALHNYAFHLVLRTCCLCNSVTICCPWKPPSGKEDGHLPTGRLFGFPEPRSFLAISKHGTNAISKPQTLVPLRHYPNPDQAPSSDHRAEPQMAAASYMLTAASLSFAALPVSRLRAALPTAASFAALRRAAAAPVVVRAAAASSKATAAAEGALKKKRATGITQPKPVSPALQAIVGAPEIPRTEALKRLWAYIKQHNLQVPEQNPYLLALYL